MGISSNLPRAGRHGLMVALLGWGLTMAVPLPGLAGPLVRRAQERRACQDFAAKLQQAGANPAAAQQVYQQGVTALVQQFGENPCTDIPPPAAAPASGAPAPGTAAPGTAAPATAPPGSAAPTAGTGAAPVSAPVGSPQQQACQQFATKVQSASATAGSVAARQTYARGLETLTGLYGANPCPAVKPPQ